MSDDAAPISQLQTENLTTHADARVTPFGASLEPVLLEACEGRLNELHWFRTDWQRGGALTGYGRYRSEENQTHDVVIKLPVPPVEQFWLMHLQSRQDIAPRLFAHGETLGQYDFAWVVMERLPHGPVGKKWGGVAFDLMVDAVVRFADATHDVPLTGEPRRKDYESICKLARDHVQKHGMGETQRWKKVLKNAQKELKPWLAFREQATEDAWCHGDVHFGNAMTRVPAPDGPIVLFDFAEVHRGHWIEDAVYFEHLFWSRRKRLEGRKLVSLISKGRKEVGLPVEADWPKLAAIQRCLLAMSTPAMLQHEGNPNHLKAALELLEAEIG